MQAVLQICDAHLSTDFTFDQNYTTNIIQLLREVFRLFKLYRKHIVKLKQNCR